MVHCKHRNLRLVGAESLGEADEGKVKLSVSTGGGVWMGPDEGFCHSFEVIRDITGSRKHLKSFIALFSKKTVWGLHLVWGF